MKAYFSVFQLQVKFTNDDQSEDVPAIPKEYENYLQAIIHKNTTYLLQLIHRDTPKIFHQYAKDIITTKVSYLYKLDHESPFRCIININE